MLLLNRTPLVGADFGGIVLWYNRAVPRSLLRSAATERGTAIPRRKGLGVSPVNAAILYEGDEQRFRCHICELSSNQALSMVTQGAPIAQATDAVEITLQTGGITHASRLG